MADAVAAPQACDDHAGPPSTPERGHARLRRRHRANAKEQIVQNPTSNAAELPTPQVNESMATAWAETMESRAADHAAPQDRRPQEAARTQTEPAQERAAPRDAARQRRPEPGPSASPYRLPFSSSSSARSSAGSRGSS